MSKTVSEEFKEKLIKANERFKDIELHDLCHIFSQSHIPTLILSKEGKIVEYNNAMSQLTGYPHEEVQNIKAWMSRLYPDDVYKKSMIEIIRKSCCNEIELMHYL